MSITELFISDMDTDTHRVCGTCGEKKPVECFYRDGKYNNGKIRYRRDCKDCYKKTRVLEAVAKAKAKGGKYNGN